jgi:hypothetical protein
MREIRLWHGALWAAPLLAQWLTFATSYPPASCHGLPNGLDVDTDLLATDAHHDPVSESAT